MSSNKYYREWEKSNSNSNSNSNYSHKKESSFQTVLNKLEKDISRLDRAIDKIETENKAKKIFDLGSNLNPHSYQCSYKPSYQPSYQPSYPPPQFIHNQIQTHEYPIYYTPTGTQYIIINGCLVMYKNGF